MKPYLHKIIPALIVVFVLCIVFKLNKHANVINSDGDGYYIYLPAFIIYRDYNFTDQHTFSAEYNKRIEQSYFARESDGKKIDQFTCGLAVLWLPFFVVAHVVSKLFSVPDGYSFVYQIAIAFAAIVYLLLGFIYLFKLFDTYRFSKLTKYIVAAGILLGTNLFHYAFFEASMSHVYSFSFITLFLYAVRCYFISNRAKYLVLSFLLLAVILLIRPFNILIILIIPFLSDDLKQFKTSFHNVFNNHYKALFSGLILFFVIASIQSIVWYIQTSHLIIDSYKDQGFHFAQPHIMNVLFGFRKGLFVYTPLLIFAVPGLFVLFRQSKYRFFVLTIFLIVIIYCVSSWWSWWYGMSYGQRAFIDYFAVFALLMALFYERLRKKTIRIVVVTLMLIFIILNQFQDWQYRNYILHWDMMTARKYVAVFLQTSKDNHTDLWKPIQNEKKTKLGIWTCFASENDLENTYDYWNNENCFVTNACGLPSGELCVETNDYFIQTPKYIRNLRDVSNKSFDTLLISYKAYYKVLSPVTSPDITFYAEIDSSGVIIRKNQNPAKLSATYGNWNLISGKAELFVKNPSAKTLKAFFVTNDGGQRRFDDFFAVLCRLH
jgi:hypothetical protein